MRTSSFTEQGTPCPDGRSSEGYGPPQPGVVHLQLPSASLQYGPSGLYLFSPGMLAAGGPPVMPTSLRSSTRAGFSTTMPTVRYLTATTISLLGIPWRRGRRRSCLTTRTGCWGLLQLPCVTRLPAPSMAAAPCTYRFRLTLVVMCMRALSGSAVARGEKSLWWLPAAL